MSNKDATLSDILDRLIQLEIKVNAKFAEIDIALLQMEQNQTALSEKQTRVDRDNFELLQTVSSGQVTTNNLFASSLKSINDAVAEIKTIKDELSEISAMKEQLAEITYSLPIVSYDDAISQPRIDKEDSIKKLRDMMVDLFSRGELTDLIIDCGLPRDIGGETHKAYADNIIKGAKSRGKFAILIQQLAHKRPHVTWSFGTDWLLDENKK